MNQNQLFLCTIILIIVETIKCYEENEYTSEYPDIFYMDDYYKCSGNKDNAYCTAHMNLIPKDEQSKLWKKIEEWSIPRHHYNRSVIHRTFCIPSKYKGYLTKKSFIETKTNKELISYNLSAKMFSMDCKEEEYSGKDIKTILTGLLIYMGLILFATIYDQICDIRTKESKFSKWLIFFSLTSNWKKITSDKNPDYQKLKCIQGIRTYQTVIIIVIHVILAFGHLYIKNTSFIEKIFSNPVTPVSASFFMFVIQTYFVISTWLLTNQILELHQKNGQFSIRDGVVIFFHRITRFWAPLLAMLFIMVDLYLNFANGPGNFETVNIMSRTCEKNWWATFFLVTNIFDYDKVCNQGMWSLSIDTQFYIICIVFLYVVLNYQLNIKKSLAYMFIFTYVINVIIYYEKECPILKVIDLKLFKRIDFFNDKTFGLNYFGFWANAGSSLVGVLFGYFYFLCKNNNKIKALEQLCGPTFFIAPVTAVLIGSMTTGRLASVLVGPLLKPMFGFGIASGIYGMSRNVIQGWVKSVCENKYAVLLGNFTFSTYVFHFLLVFSRGSSSTSLVEVTPVKLILSSLIDVVKSFALGILCTLVIEQPGINIKKMILPKVQGKEELSTKDHNNHNNYNKDDNKQN